MMNPTRNIIYSSRGLNDLLTFSIKKASLYYLYCLLFISFYYRVFVNLLFPWYFTYSISHISDSHSFHELMGLAEYKEDASSHGIGTA